MPSGSGQVQEPEPTSYDVAVLPHRNAYASDVATGAIWGLAGAPRVGRSAAYRLSGTVVTTTEPFDSSAAIISPLSSAMPMWTRPTDLLPMTSRSPGWICAFGTAR